MGISPNQFFVVLIQRDVLSCVDIDVGRFPFDDARDLDRIVGAHVHACEATSAFPVVNPPVPSLHHDRAVPAGIVASTA